MKKLLMITLSLLLFTFLISPVQAKRLGPLDRPLPDYNNLTLRQIFEEGQLFLNPDFDNNVDSWIAVASANTWLSGGFLKNTATGTQIYSIVRQSFQADIAKYYYRYKVRVTNAVSTKIVIELLAGYKVTTINNPVENQWYEGSDIANVVTAGNWANNIYQYYTNTATALDKIMEVDYFYVYNLTALGIPTTTKIEMDNLYLEYIKYKDMMTSTDVMLIVGQLVAFVWSLVVSFEIFGFVLWEYALFGIGAGFIGYLALKIIQKKAGDDNGDSD